MSCIRLRCQRLSVAVPKIIINDTINLFFNCDKHFGNFHHNSFRVLFDEIASVYF